MSVYYTGWGPMKHVVFFAHGKYGQWFSTFDYYCVPESVPSRCNGLADDGVTAVGVDLQIDDFKHLVFTFGGSGIKDTGASTYNGAQGWSTDVDDGSEYADAANVLSSQLITKIKKNSAGSNIGALNCRYKCRYVCKYEKELDKETHRQLRGFEFDKFGAKESLRNPFGAQAKTDYIVKRCYRTCSSTCPFNHRTEMMVIGYSDGGGLATYMNYHSPLVTKAVAIDFWGFGGYEGWLAAGGVSFDLSIYTGCESSIWHSGPAAILPDATPTGYTYPSGGSEPGCPSHRSYLDRRWRCSVGGRHLLAHFMVRWRLEPLFLRPWPWHPPHCAPRLRGCLLVSRSIGDRLHG